MYLESVGICAAHIFVFLCLNLLVFVRLSQEVERNWRGAEAASHLGLLVLKTYCLACEISLLAKHKDKNKDKKVAAFHLGLLVFKMY